MNHGGPIPLLIVDDDPVFARLVRQLVLSLGPDLQCTPEWVGTAEKAVSELNAHAYELVLLDYNLPDADGLKVLARIRELPGPRQPAVVMLTASGSEAVAVEAMKRGAKDYLTKAGLDLPPLMRALQTALRQKRLADQVEAYHAQIEDDLQMARNLQRALLPDRFPSFPRQVPPAKSAFQFCYRFQPVTTLAGDFFDVLALSDTEAAVFICDVMGHGVRSALVTAMLRALVEDLAPTTPDPSRFLAELNRRLAGTLAQAAGTLFATAFYLVADSAAGHLRYANAGHPRPLHLSVAEDCVRPLPLPAAAGPALGLFGEAKYITGQCPISVGDRVLFFTDGLIEIAGAGDGKVFGPPQLLAATRARLRLPTEQLLDDLIAEARGAAGGAEFDDDLCLLAMGRAA